VFQKIAKTGMVDDAVLDALNGTLRFPGNSLEEKVLTFRRNFEQVKFLAS
jgi:hypothetical protein